MKVKDLIIYLKTLPEETDVHVLEVIPGVYHDSYGYTPLVIEENTDFADMRENPFAKGKPHENAIDLYLGEY
jgi:hypothetical protein